MKRPVARATAVGLVLLIGAGGGGQAPQASARNVVDGDPTPAACAPLGFTVRDETSDQEARRPAPSSPQPPTLPIEATKKEDRVESAAPPPPPPPPPPLPLPPPPLTTADSMAVSGARVPQGAAPVMPMPPRPPLVAPGAPERYPDADPNAVVRTADNPVSTFAIDVDTASYSNVRRFIRDGAAPPADAVRVEELINYFDYGYAPPASADEPFSIVTGVSEAPWAEGRQIVHVGLQGYQLPDGQRRPLNLTFLVDVSGSMRSPDKLGLAQRSMNLVIDRLRPEDRVAVTYYASGAGTLLPPTPGTDKLRLRCAVASLRAGGATAGAQGMTNAYDQAEAAFGADRVNRILMFTDGDFNVGVTADKSLEDYVADKRETGIYLSIYGLGRGNYQDARMQAISQAGNGVAAYVDDLDEARRLFGPMFDRGAFPIADDAKIQVEFNPARVAEWRLIGYETRLLAEEDFANDAIDGGEVGSGAAVTALYEITPTGGPMRVPERRYEANRPAAPAGDPSGELGFVQVRFKPPGGDTSRLIQQPIQPGARAPSEAARWAIAVAGFGQKLRDDPWLDPDYAWADVIRAAQGARGEDPWGDRAEFVRLARAAESLPPRRVAN